MSAWVPEHSKRVSKASAKVTDAANTSRPELKSHQRAQDTVISITLGTMVPDTDEFGNIVIRILSQGAFD